MVEDSQVQRAHKAIVDECELLLASDAFDAWKGAESLHAGDFVMCNNSFLFREGRSTTKSSYYIGIEVTEGPNFKLPPVVLVAASRINLQFKRLASRELARYEVTDLATALSEELPQMGSIVFSLAGRIGDPEPAEVPLSGVSEFQHLRYAPNRQYSVDTSSGAISIPNVSDLDSAWSEVSTALTDAGADPSHLGAIFESAFNSLQEAATRLVDPSDVSETAPSILSNILHRMEEQVDSFSTILEQHQRNTEDNDIYNELLRVAYNFADGARSFLGLMVGICDLKPVLFWLTMYEQVDLAHRFGQLPFSLVGSVKPSLERYRSVIADARNQAFHDLFAFDHPFRVKLSDDALRSPELRLFREYAKRNDPALSFEDRSLVELLATLTRTPERPVPVGFWHGNEEVMSAVVEVVRALKSALTVVAPSGEL